MMWIKEWKERKKSQFVQTTPFRSLIIKVLFSKDMVSRGFFVLFCFIFEFFR